MSRINHKSLPFSKPDYPNLDGFRFLCFLLTFLAHSFNTDDMAIKIQPWFQLFKVRLFANGDIGISFFFVLSGFLITSLLIVEKEQSGTINIGHFYLRRTLRIWPLYYFVVFFGFLIFPTLKQLFGGTIHEIADPWLCFTFLNNFQMIKGNPDASILGVMWTVAIEEQFYLIWPLLLLVCPQKYYPVLMLTVIFISNCFRLIYVKTIPIDFHTLGVITDMAVGGLAAYLCYYNSRFFLKIQLLSRGWIFVLYLLALSFLVIKKEMLATETAFALKRLIIGPVFALIILEQNFAGNSFFKMGRFRLLTRLGKYTYGLYCLHFIAILTVVTLLKYFGFYKYGWQMWVLEIPGSLALSIIMSLISYRYFEKPFLMLKNRFQEAKT